MHPPVAPFDIISSTAHAARLDAAAAFLRDCPPARPVTIVAANRAAADDLARLVAVERGATFGIARFSLTQLAARLALARLAERGMTPASSLGTEAVAARASFDTEHAQALTWLAPVSRMPGFPRALAHTLADARASALTPADVLTAGNAGPDLARLWSAADRELTISGTADRAMLFATAAAVILEGPLSDPCVGAPLLLIDLEITSEMEERFVTALISLASRTIATSPRQDERTCAALQRAGGVWRTTEEPQHDDLGSLRTFLFSETTPPARALDGSLEFFSAPGEGRECVEIARRILTEARRGVPFDRMAIMVRAPRQYQGLLEQALRRAGIPAWFDRGTRRPHPAGRAFLALLACATEGLSARRFAEYLSLGQLPRADAPTPWVPSADELLGIGEAAIERADERAGRDVDVATHEDADDVDEDDASEGDVGPESAAVAGTLRAPRRWERMLVEAAVIGGDPARWARRLDGLDAELSSRIDELRRQDPASSRIAGIERTREHLGHLRECALPLIGEMAGWPAVATWGEWLACLERFTPRVVRVPAHVLRVLADLRPMSAIGPVSLEEVRSVLAERLRQVDAEPPRRRGGRVFIGTPAHARGRTFRVVFIPGLAERMFPQKPVQDPLLPDPVRERLGPGLATRRDRRQHQRVLLHLAAGAATERLYVSYPRLDVAESRARVPSFYALDLLRGATGKVPDYETLAGAAAQAGDATLAWPAPRNADLAIDDQEHDLAVLRELLDARDPETVRGHAQYLLRLNPALKRAVTERWARGERRWSQFDGLVRVTDATRDALTAQRLGTRPYSLSALQRFAACPYQFLLSAIHRLHAVEPPEPLQRLDPLTRGSIVHRMQATLLRELRDKGALPIVPASLDSALLALEGVITRVGADYRETLAPAIDRVWREELRGIARDLRGWLHHVADDGHRWTPRFFELSFGLERDADHDPDSVTDPALIDGRYKLRGSVDLVEERSDGLLRVTDHKTGKDRTRDGLTIGGGLVLQPVLYSLAVEQVTGRTVQESRLFFCTSAAGYKRRPVALTPQSRRAGVEALEIIDRAIENGSLAPAPAEGACTWCDFRPVCGPGEERRVQRKPAARLRDLWELRSRP